MDQQQALNLLGLNDGASAEDIQSALLQKQQSLKVSIDKAPTDALKQKFQASLDQLVQAKSLLLGNHVTHEGKQSHTANVKSPLTQTKLDDLPKMTSQDEIEADAIGLHEGQLLANRYIVQEKIGDGGMGVVYRATDTSMSKEIALKVLLPSLLSNERARERFLDEARISQQLSHPNIVNVYDVQQEGELYFLTMELLEGQDLRQLMQNRKLARQPFNVEEVLELLAPICEGLSYAHKYTVHRDIKPENIFITEDNDIKIMDFGIARVQSTSQRTQTGAAMGTAYYMAPEQLRGAKDVDGRADQYALGVMAYELLSGEVPAGRIDPLKKLCPGVSQSVSNAVDQALSNRAQDRFESCLALAEALSFKSRFSFQSCLKPLIASVAITAVVFLLWWLLPLLSQPYPAEAIFSHDPQKPKDMVVFDFVAGEAYSPDSEPLLIELINKENGKWFYRMTRSNFSLLVSFKEVSEGKFQIHRNAGPKSPDSKVLPGHEIRTLYTADEFNQLSGLWPYSDEDGVRCKDGYWHLLPGNMANYKMAGEAAYALPWKMQDGIYSEESDGFEIFIRFYIDDNSQTLYTASAGVSSGEFIPFLYADQRCDDSMKAVVDDFVDYTKNGVVKAGKKKAAVCAACHGVDGNSRIPLYPRLAGKDAHHLATQLRGYRDGDIVDPVMSAMARSLTDKDIADLAVYYETMSAKNKK